MLLRTTSTGIRTSASRRSGFVIVAVLMVVTVLSLAAYQYSALMDAEVMAAERIRKTTEAKAAADSGLIVTMAYVSDPAAFEGVLNSNPFDNPSVFQSVVVSDGQSATSQSRFSLVSLDYSQPPTAGALPLKYGVTDEAGKINVNALFALDTSGKVLHDALMKLPNMTDDIAWSIVDWIDPNEEESPGGAEDAYYVQLSGNPYHCKNAPLDSIEELLLVKGVTPALLFGTDRNRNGRIDPGEDDGTGFSIGWSAYLTVYSREPNVDSTGNPRINLNGDDLVQLNTDLTNAVGTTWRHSSSAIGSSARVRQTPARVRQTYMSSGGVLSITIMTGGPTGSLGQLQQKVQEALNSSTPPKARQRISSLFSLIEAKVALPVQSQGGNGKGGKGKGGQSQQTAQVTHRLRIKSSRSI